MMSSLLKSLADDLHNQIGETKTILNHMHFNVLKYLAPIEKQIIGRTVLEWGWNVGSTNVMKFLQKANVLSMTEMIMFANNQDNECAQLILTDLLETEFILLADLMKNLNCTDSTSLMISDILNEGFKRLCKDIIENPGDLTKNYLCETEQFLIANEMEQACLMHLILLLQESPSNSIFEAISNQSSWNNEFNDEPTTFNSFIDFIIGTDYKKRYKTLTFLLEKCGERKFRGWKWWLLLLRRMIRFGFSVNERNELKTITKKFLKDIFNKASNSEYSDQFYIMFLVARQITRYNEAILGNYTTWFKDNVGEMKYFLKIEEFRIVMEHLTKLLEFESDEEVLNIQINTYMPAPLHCNELVLNYKQLCRSKLLHLQRKTNPPQPIDEDIFLIDDSD